MANKRVSLIGSEELFRATRAVSSEAEATEAPASVPQLELESPAPAVVPAAPAPRTSTVAESPLPPTPRVPAPPTAGGLHLTRVEIAILVDALQKVKHPEKVRATNKPTMGQYEDLEALRQKLLNAAD